MIDELRESLRTGLLFGNHDEPLDDASKRVLRVIVGELERREVSDTTSARWDAAYLRIVALAVREGQGHKDSPARLAATLEGIASRLDYMDQIDRPVAVCSQCGSPRIQKDPSQEHPGVGLCPDCGGGFIVDLRDSPSWMRIVEFHRQTRNKVLDEVKEKLKNVQHVSTGSSFGVTFGDWVRTALAAVDGLRGE